MKRHWLQAFAFVLLLLLPSHMARGEELPQPPSYMQLRQTYVSNAYQGEAITVSTDVMLTPGSCFSIPFTVPEEGLYEIHVTYQNTTQTILPTELTVLVDDSCFFTEMKQIRLRSLWVDDGEFPLDRYGNELASIPVAAAVEQRFALSDATGRTMEPFLFDLTAGEHTLTLQGRDGESRITAITFCAPSTIPSYVAGQAKGSQIIVLEGERMSSRNSSSIRGGSAYITSLNPYSADCRRINHLAGSSFYHAGDMVTYTFEVSEAGYYYFGSYYRQDVRQDCPVWADLLIDGAVPHEAALALPFDYATDFTYMRAEKDGAPVVFYLTEGMHTLSLRLNATPLTEANILIEQIIAEINLLSQEITQLSGGVTTDRYRYYDVLESIPDAVERLERWAGQCDAMLQALSAFSPDGSTTAFSYFQLAAEQLRRLAKEPENLPRRLSELSSSSSSVAQMLAQQMLDMSYNNLSIDQLYLYQEEAVFPKKAGGMEALWQDTKRFFHSFTKQDYTASSAQEGNLQVWMGESRQMLETLQHLIDTYFTPETGIQVDLAMLPSDSKLVLSNAAGKSPDVALSMGFVTPSYLDVRGALYDLSQFEDFPEVAQRFHSNLFVPYIYDEGVYALPQQILFWVMYYRSDILESLNLEVPDTIEDVKDMLPELQAQGMNFYYPTAGMSGIKTFAGTLPLILQSGGSIYGELVGDTTLDTEASLNGFKELTELFSVYSLPIDVGTGFYQRFRDGTHPIGINELGMYNLLNNTAPELEGRWDIALIPGLVQEDGTVARYTTGNMKAMGILANTDMPEEAWTFLKWWSSAEVQSLYANQLFITYGKDVLWTSANTEAFAQLPIKQSHRDVILEQMEWMLDAPWCLGTYMVERELSNAYLSVVVEGEDPRRALDKAIKRIDRETYRKLEEFGYYKDGTMVKEYITPDASLIDAMIEAYEQRKREE